MMSYRLTMCAKCLRNIGIEHEKFYRHLLNGGSVFRDDAMNDVKEVLTAQVIIERKGCLCKIQHYGFLNLSCIPNQGE